MGDHDAQKQEQEIRRLREEVVEAKLRSMIAEARLNHALRALEGQSETLNLVNRSVASMLATIEQSGIADQSGGRLIGRGNPSGSADLPRKRSEGEL